MSAEVRQDIETIGPLRRGGETKKDSGPDVIEQPHVTRRGGVVKLVDDHEFILIGRQFVERAAQVALDRNEQVIELARRTASDQSVAEIGVAENVSKRLEALLKQLLAVSDEEKPRPLSCRRLLFAGPAAIVERRDHRLARAGGSHDQVAVTALNLAFGVQPVEDLLLKRPGP